MSQPSLNLYGPTAGPQHTLFGRVVPMMGALQLALARAAEQPMPAVPFAGILPAWGTRLGMN